MEKLLACSNYKQFQLIWTVIQPAMHRDFMYTAKKEFPSLEFMPISTHTTRKLKVLKQYLKIIKPLFIVLNFVFCVQDKQMYMRQDNYYRVSSAHLQNYDQVKEINRETPTNDEIDETKRRQPQSPSRSNKLPMISVHARNANTPARNLAPSRGLSRRSTRVT